MKHFLSLVLSCIFVASLSAQVKEHGRLHVHGNEIVGQDGKPVSLAGNSLFWSQEQGKFWDARTIKWLKKDWKTQIVRAAMGVEWGGYLDHPDQERAKVIKVVDAAIANDLYVIIDWHDHRAQLHTREAIVFFQDMARRYARYPNVIYELYNEPIGDTSWKDAVKPYSEQVIAVIRAIDPNNLIVVGSPHWSQDVDVAANDPIKDSNVAYSLHFYAGSHKEFLRDKAVAAMSRGVALMVTEWGSCNADGNGAIDRESTREWMDFMRKYHLIHCNWAVSDKKETSSIVVNGTSPAGKWREDQLTDAGKFVRGWVRSWSETPQVADRQ
ncbi:MAG TPA: glycoside hydrolase family 5 protein [Opitutaceae bacterium]